MKKKCKKNAPKIEIFLKIAKKSRTRFSGGTVSEENELKFLSLKFQKYTLHQLIMKMISDLELCNICDVCDALSYNVVDKCFTYIVNDLNNYRKVLTDSVIYLKKNKKQDLVINL